MKLIDTEILEVVDESESTKTFRLEMPWLIKSSPGQYMMAWVKGVDDIPMSLSSKDTITVQSVGDASSALLEYQAGDHLGLRGPFGNGFELVGGSIAIIAGGMGAAPLAYLAESARENGNDVTTIIGAKKSVELLFLDRFDAAGDLFISTDDGSKGRKGFVTDILKGLDLDSFDQIYTCGPEVMMSRVLKVCEDIEIPHKLQLSIQRYIKCAVGLCGSCCIDPIGLRACKEGPVFTGDQLIGSEFGKYRRDASGNKVSLNQI